MTKFTEQERTYHRQLILENALNLFEKRNILSHKSIIKSQKSFINNLNILGKKKYESIELLNNYFKNPDKQLAEQIFYNTISKKCKNFKKLI